MNRTIFYGFILLFITGCVQTFNPDKVYESARKQGTYVLSPGQIPPGCKGCLVYPKYHPGDLLAHKGVSLQKTKKMIVVILGDYVNQEFWDECVKKCRPTSNCEDKPPLSKEYESCKDKITESQKICRDSCITEKYDSASLPKHIEGGYYSDGSYYATTGNSFHYFSNIHPTRLTYKKSKWQKERDECLEITFHNLKKIWPEAQEYYLNCLKERGYDISYSTSFMNQN